MTKSYVLIWAKALQDSKLPTLSEQRAQLGELQPAWHSFVFQESARAADEIGFGRHPISFYNDVLYTGA